MGDWEGLMATYLEKVEQWCGEKMGIGVGAGSMAFWIMMGFNQDAGGYEFASGKLMISAEPIKEADLQYRVRVEVISAEGNPPMVRLNDFELVAWISPATQSREMERISVSWSTLDMQVVEDANRSGRIHFEYSASTRATANSLGRSPDFDKLLASTGLSRAEYKTAVDSLLDQASSEAFASIMVRQLPFPDYRAYLAGIQIGVGVELSTVGSRIWIKGLPQIEEAELHIHSNVIRQQIHQDGSSSKLDIPPSLPILWPADQEALSKPVNIYLPLDHVATVVNILLPATFRRLRTSPLNLIPTQGIVQLQARRESLSCESNYGVAGELPAEWKVRVRYTGNGVIHASQFDLCSEQSPAPSTVTFDTGVQTLHLSLTRLQTGNRLMSYRVSGQAATVQISPLTTPIQNCFINNEINNYMYDLFSITAGAANIPWLNVESMPGHDQYEELPVMSAPGGLLLTRMI
jgi:hypothetical protein